MKIKYNKKKIRSIIVAASLAGSLVAGSVHFGFHLNKETHLPDFYYLNTKNIDLESDELLDEFDKIYNDSDVLQKYWQDIYPQLSDFILKYGTYLDQEELLDTLPDLKIKVTNKISNDKRFLAVTKSDDVSITLNERLFFKKSTEIKEVILHEAFHYLFQQNFSNSPLSFSNLGRQLDEGIATLLTQEYNCYDGVNMPYKKSVNYVQVLCELIGAENYMKATGKHNISELINYISQYCSKNDATNLIKHIDKACIYYDTKATDDDKKAWKIINQIYEAKNGITIEESSDLVMKIYSNNLLDTDYFIDGARYNHHAYVHKNYFVNFTQPYITYIQNGKQYGEIKLDSNNNCKTGVVLKEGYYSDNGTVINDDGNEIIEQTINYNKPTEKVPSK